MRINIQKISRGLSTDPETFFKGLFLSIPRYIRLCFVSSVLFGLVVHVYMFTHKMFNHDDTGHLFGSDYGAASGRWLLPKLLGLDGNLSMPWLIGVISLLFLALSACLIASVMRIRRPVSVLLLSALVVSFPSTTSTFIYMFSANAYFFSLALACLAAFLADRYRFGFIGGAAALFLSLSIYQGYLGVSAFLMLGALILYTLDGKMPLKEIWLRAVKSAAVLALAVAIYLLSVKITTRSTGLVNYMGISDMGKLKVSEIPALVSTAYFLHRLFFIWNYYGVHFGFLKYAFALTALATVLLIASAGIRARLSLPRWLVLVFFIAVYPLAGNLIVFMTSGVEPHMLMLYGFTSLLIAPLAVANLHTGYGEEAQSAKLALSLSQWIILLTAALTVYGYSVFANEVYFKLQLSYEQTAAYSIRLINAIESSEYYTEDSTVILAASQPVAYDPTPELDSIQLTGLIDFKGIVNSYTYGLYLKRYLGFQNTVYDTQSQRSMEFAYRSEVLDLPCYPAEGCITELDGYIVVRLS